VAPVSDIAAPASTPVGFYSELAMREVIAGCEKTIGVWRGKSSACALKVNALTDRIAEITAIATHLNMWRWLAPVLVGGAALLVGGALGFGLGFGLRLGVVSP
jgi:hypothetical protein